MSKPRDQVDSKERVHVIMASQNTCAARFINISVRLQHLLLELFAQVAYCFFYFQFVILMAVLLISQAVVGGLFLDKDSVVSLW